MTSRPALYRLEGAALSNLAASGTCKHSCHVTPVASGAGWASIAKGGGSDRNRNFIEPIETTTLPVYVTTISVQHGLWTLNIESISKPNCPTV